MKVILELRDVPLTQLGAESEENFINEFARVWVGRGQILQSHFVLDAYKFERFGNTTSLLLADGSIVILQLSSDTKPVLFCSKPESAASVFGYITMRKMSAGDVELLLFGAGDSLAYVDLEGRDWRTFFSTNEDVDLAAPENLDDVLRCDQILSKSGERDPSPRSKK